MSGIFTFAVIIDLRRCSKHAKFPACKENKKLSLCWQQARRV